MCPTEVKKDLKYFRAIKNIFQFDKGLKNQFRKHYITETNDKNKT